MIRWRRRSVWWFVALYSFLVGLALAAIESGADTVVVHAS